MTARAWCEAQIERRPEFLDPEDSREARPENFKSPINRTCVFFFDNPQRNDIDFRAVDEFVPPRQKP